jgi:voltage-gated potassium channel
VYFSIVTMATVGYGDIVPKTIVAKVLVLTEILLGVGYSIFFFSIISSFMRERPAE